jgi:hypothetical protein
MPAQLFHEGDKVRVRSLSANPEGKITEIEFEEGHWFYRVALRSGSYGDWYSEGDLEVVSPSHVLRRAPRTAA